MRSLVLLSFGLSNYPPILKWLIVAVTIAVIVVIIVIVRDGVKMEKNERRFKKFIDKSKHLRD